MNTRKDRKVQFSDYTKHVTDQIQNADVARDQSMARLQIIRDKRQKSQERQLGRLEEKYGKDHPRFKRQAIRIEAEIEMNNYLKLSIDRSKDDIDTVEGTFVLKGRVIAKNIKGLAGLTLQLIDNKNNIIDKPSKTDKRGFYQFVIEVDERLESKKLGIVVLDKQGTQIHKERLPVVISVDGVESRDIVLNTDGRFDSSVMPVVKKKSTARKRKVAMNKKVSAKVPKKSSKKKIKATPKKTKKVSKKRKSKKS